MEEDPDQTVNLAADPKYAEVKKLLSERLTAQLRSLQDPRETSGEVQFDDYPYIGGVPKYPGDQSFEQYRMK